ncbi:MAG: PEP-CTERM sorting domain-containing protein [Nitrospiraceae bacterium]|nr:MAG: PEP-CTERM sorting domain-containing protein [Nitrospiraceae bacterium]
MFYKNVFKAGLISLIMFCSLLLPSIKHAQASTAASLYTNLALWEAAVFNIELFETTASNIVFADEVLSVPGPNTNVGTLLTFQASNTGLSRSFTIETLQSGAQFTFDDDEQVGSARPNIPEYDNALSVGDKDGYDDDDWRLKILNGPAMTAFAFEIRDSYFAPGESIKLYSGNVLMDKIDLGFLADGKEHLKFFLGVTTNYDFDRIDFIEHPKAKEGVGDDIAIADLRFATVVPEPSSYILFFTGLLTLGLLTWRRRKN